MAQNNNRMFIKEKLISKGAFCEVYKIRYTLTNEVLALKIINKSKIYDLINVKKPDLEAVGIYEINLMKDHDPDYIVQYKHHWLDGDNFNITMELCDDNLSNIINIKYQAFQRKSRVESMSLLEFYLSCKLFGEIAECLVYLHNRISPIIHRDLKPANILVLKRDNGRFLKIGDFGLSKFYHESQIQTKGIGTTKYMAPELYTNKYNTKADIYSFGIIAQDLFDVDCFSSEMEEMNVQDDLKKNFKVLFNLLIDMINLKYKERPDAAKILQSMKLWKITAKEMFDKINYCFNEEVSKLQTFDNKFFFDYITIMLKLDPIYETNHERTEKSSGLNPNDVQTSGYDTVDKVVDMFKGIIIHNGKFEDDFSGVSETIGFGSYGIVVKAKNKINDKEYAIKKIIIRSHDDYLKKMSELKVWAKINNDSYIQYVSHWVEKHDQNEQDQFLIDLLQDVKLELNSVSFADFKKEKNVLDFALLHIQMDFCSFSLREGLNKIKTYFNLNSKQLLSDLAYYISSELLLEILKAIDYLHTSEPPILHRDIKPENILIKQSPNAKFIKIGEFGISVFHEYPEISHTQMRGTIRYMAPEVMTSRKYDTKADIYSIGVMIQELFNFDINFNPPDTMTDKYKKIIELTGLAMNGQRKARPSCSKFIKTKDDWTINYNKVKSEIVQIINSSKEYDLDENFVQTFLKAKYDLNEN